MPSGILQVVRVAEPRKETFRSCNKHDVCAIPATCTLACTSNSLVGLVVLRHVHGCLAPPASLSLSAVGSVQDFIKAVRNPILLDKEALTPKVPALRRCRMATSSLGPSPY